jgi:hypothetical protein
MSTIKTPVDIIDSAVRETEAQIRYMKERRAILKSSKVRNFLTKFLQPLVYAMGEAGHMNVRALCNKPNISIYMYDLDSFKQRELVWVLEYLTAETEKFNGEIKSKDYAEAINRDFHFVTDKWEASIVAYVKRDSATCRKVVIGTEMVEQHKYQIVCD